MVHQYTFLYNLSFSLSTVTAVSASHFETRLQTNLSFPSVSHITIVISVTTDVACFVLFLVMLLLSSCIF